MAQLAAAFPARPHVVAAAVLALAVLVALVYGARRGRSALAREIPVLAYFGAAGVALCLPAALPRHLAVGAAALAFVVHVGNAWRRSVDDPAPPAGPTWPALLYLALALATAATFLFYDLGGEKESVLVWESATIQGFSNTFHAGVSGIDFAREQLLWGTGVLSDGHASLLYGSTTYALMKSAGFTTWNLRVVAALWALLSVAVAFLFARRFFGDVVAAASAMAMTFSVSNLYHGRYGVAVTSTFLAALVALLCVCLFLDRERHAWWMGAVAGGALYLATLEYATGRVVAVLLLAFAVLYSLARYDRLRWRRLLGLASLCAVVALLWQYQQRHGTAEALLQVRGEQYFVFSAVPHTYEVELGERRNTVTLSDRIALLRTVVARTARQFYDATKPSTADLHPGAAATSYGRLVKPYFAPLVVFLLLGLACSLRWARAWRHACLLWCALGTSAALLLTTGVDAHRVAILAVPCAIWIGLGARESAAVLSRLQVPVPLRHVLALALCAACALNLANQLYFPRVPRSERGRLVLDETARVDGPVVLASDWDGLEVSWVFLGMLERSRRHPGWQGSLLDPRLLHAIHENRTPSPEIVRELTDLTRRATLLLAPAEQFRVAADALRNEGLAVSESGTQVFGILRIDRRPQEAPSDGP